MDRCLNVDNCTNGAAKVETLAAIAAVAAVATMTLVLILDFANYVTTNTSGGGSGLPSENITLQFTNAKLQVVKPRPEAKTRDL